MPTGVQLENDTPAGRINANEILLGNDVNLMDLLTTNNMKSNLYLVLFVYSGLSSQS
jgi:hypothetical protein